MSSAPPKTAPAKAPRAAKPPKAADTATPPASGAPDAAAPAPQATRRYVCRIVAIRHNGRVHAPGDELALTPAEAARLAGLVQPVQE